MKDRPINRPRSEPIILLTLVGLFVFLLQAVPCRASQPGPEWMECQGEVRPGQRYQLRLGPGEAAAEVMVHAGDRVLSGQELARLGNPILAARLGEMLNLQAESQEAKTRLKLLEMQLEQLQKLVERTERRLAAEREIAEKTPQYPLEIKVEVLEERLEDLHSQIRQARLKRETLRLNLAERRDLDQVLAEQIQDLKKDLVRLTIKAPFGGLVVISAPEPFRAQPGEVLLELWDDSSLEVRAVVLQHQLPLVKPGSEAMISLAFSDQDPVRGRVRKVEPTPSGGRSEVAAGYGVLIDLESAPGRLKPGMVVIVKIRTNPGGH